LLKSSQRKDESTIQYISPDTWRTYFQGLLHTENNINNIAINEGKLPDSILNSKITADGVIASINKLKMGNLRKQMVLGLNSIKHGIIL